MDQPTLETQRLLLRPFSRADALEVQRLAGDVEVSKHMLQVPYPYPDGVAEAWIGQHAGDFNALTGVHFAIVVRQGLSLCGAISLVIRMDHRRAGMGYWLGKSFWGHGFATEAVKAVIAYGFTQLNLNRIVAEHFSINPASGRVMQKAGMTHEGRFRQHFQKQGQFVDSEVYGILASEWVRP